MLKLQFLFFRFLLLLTKKTYCYCSEYNLHSAEYLVSVVFACLIAIHQSALEMLDCVLPTHGQFT